MIHQSTLPLMELKTLTRVGTGTTFTVAPGIVMSVTPDSAGTGSYLLIRNSGGFCDQEHVTTTAAAFAVGTNFIPVTPVIGNPKYIRADTISNVQVNSPGSLLILLSDDKGMDQAASLAVTESVADIADLIASVQEGGVGQQLTAGTTPTQAGGTVVTQSSVNVVTVTTPGDSITLSDAQPFVIMINRTSNWARVFPPVGSQIGTCATNKAVRLLGYSVALFRRISSTSWVYEVLEQSSTSYKTSATGSATVVTARNASITIASPTNCFIEYGDATTGEIPPVANIKNTGSSSIKVKFAGDFIDAASDTAITSPYEIPANTSADFCYDATGKVVVSGIDSVKVAAKLVLGYRIFNATGGAGNSTGIGATAAAKITNNSQFRMNGISAINAGTVGSGFVVTIVAGTSIAIQAVDAAGANLATDVCSILGEIVF